MLFGLILTTEYLVIIALSAIVVAAAVGFFFRKDQALERKQLAWLGLSRTMDKYGFKHIASILTKLGIKDFAGAFGEAEHLAREMADPKIAAVMLEESFITQLKARLETEGDRLKILKIVEDWRTANPPTAPITIVEDPPTTVSVPAGTVSTARPTPVV